MHILLLYPNNPRITYTALPGPYGLEVIRTHLQTLPVDCDIVNPYITMDPEKSIVDSLRPDTKLIGVSIRNIDDAQVLWDSKLAGGKIQPVCCIDDVLAVIELVRRHKPDVPVVLGGVVFNRMPTQMLDYLGADAGITGRAEIGFAELVSNMAVDKIPFEQAIQNVPGAVYRPEGNHIVHNDEPRGGEFLPVIERESVYFNIRSDAAVRTIVGCAQDCPYCIEGNESGKILLPPVDVVMEEIKGVVERYPVVDEIMFADPETNHGGVDRTIELLSRVRQNVLTRELKLDMSITPRPCNRKLVEAIADSGCMFQLSVDHVSDDILARNGINHRFQHIRDFVSWCGEIGLGISFVFLFGMPGETKESVDEVLRYVESIPDRIVKSAYYSMGLRIYPGTPLGRAYRNNQLDQRWIYHQDKQDPACIQPTAYCESWDLFELHEHVRERTGKKYYGVESCLRNITAETYRQLDHDFRLYHIGIAERESGDDPCWEAWKGITGDVSFLSKNKLGEFLWQRGQMALERELPGTALNDWETLKERIEAGTVKDRDINEINSGIETARTADGQVQGKG